MVGEQVEDYRVGLAYMFIDALNEIENDIVTANPEMDRDAVTQLLAFKAIDLADESVMEGLRMIAGTRTISTTADYVISNLIELDDLVLYARRYGRRVVDKVAWSKEGF